MARVSAVRATHSGKRRAVIIDLLIGLGLPIIRMPLRTCAHPFTLNRLFYTTAMQITLFRVMAMCYWRISALSFLLVLRPCPSLFTSRGPCSLVLYL